MKLRLLVAIITTLLDDLIIFALLIWGLPILGIKLPMPILIAALIIWAGLSTVIYTLGTRALRKKPLGGMTDMIGFQGTVIRDLDPEGMVVIKGERWKAWTVEEFIRSGEKVVVESQTGLTLKVRKV